MTADHGFLYQDTVLPESGYLSTQPQGDALVQVKSRYVLGHGLKDDPAFKTFAPGQVGLSSALEIQIPKSIRRLKVGGGSRYVHGGASLQEIVVPVLAINKKRKSDVRQVNVQVQPETDRITTGQLVVKLHQSEPVTDKVRPRTLRAGLFVGEDLISNQVQLAFDQESTDPRDRYQTVALLLNKDADAYNNRIVEFRLEEEIPNTSQWRVYQRAPYTLRGSHRIIDRVSVVFNEKTGLHEASFENLGISRVLVDEDTVNRNEKLLVDGVWCICDIEYFQSDDSRVVPWILGSLKPIQMSSFDFEGYLEARREFTSEEWVDLLMQSIGFNPDLFGRRAKLLQLVRLIPFVERNYNLVELGPKGTGKSHIFSEFSPHGMLISGGEVTVPKLFVNNSNGKIGLVGYWDVVAFDEFAGKKKRTDRALVDIMKNYMANKSFSRGVTTLGAEASMVFVGNTSHTVPYMLKHSDLFDELPESYHDSAYLDRLHHYIPGWEVETIRGEMFSEGYGFVVDYLAEVLRFMRNSDFSDRYQEYFTLGSNISTRDRDGIHKTFSGLMKIMYPTGEASRDQIEELLRFSIEGRKRVKDQILRIDPTFEGVDFGYTDTAGGWHPVTTLEEEEYPVYYWSRGAVASSPGTLTEESPSPSSGAMLPSADSPSYADSPSPVPPSVPALFEGHRDFVENQRGVSYESLLLPYLRGAAVIELHDPYIRMGHQGRNLVELLALIAAAKDPADEVTFRLFTTLEDDPNYQVKQLQMLESIMQGAAQQGLRVEVAKDPGGHDRWISTDTGWRINLGRGLDIFQKSDGGWFDLGTSRQEFRQVKAFGVTYIREG